MVRVVRTGKSPSQNSKHQQWQRTHITHYPEAQFNEVRSSEMASTQTKTQNLDIYADFKFTHVTLAVTTVSNNNTHCLRCWWYKMLLLNQTKFSKKLPFLELVYCSHVPFKTGLSANLWHKINNCTGWYQFLKSWELTGIHITTLGLERG